MNSSSIYMILIFVAIGYVAHPIVLPFVEDKLPQAEQEFENAAPKAIGQPALAENTVATAVVPVAPVVMVKEDVAKVSPRIIEGATEPEPVVEEAIKDPIEESDAQVIASEAQVVAAMQKSVKAVEVTEFGYDDVRGWALAGEEDFEGVSYQIGLATVNTTTIFGLTERNVKALYSNKRVVKWLWAASGVEIQ